MSSSASHTILACAGGIAGAIEACLVQPLEVIKVRFQLNHGNNGSIISCAKEILTEKSSVTGGGGGSDIKVSRLFRGLLPELCGMFPTRSVMYSSNELAKRVLLGNTTNGRTMKEETTSVIALAGAFSGVAEACSTTPFQLVKVRLQAKAHLGKYTNSFDCVKKVLKEEGIMAFSNGLSATMGRNGVFNCVYFTVMYKIKQYSPTTPQDSKVKATLHSLVTGFIGGVMATMCNAPFDVVKSRIQAQCPNSQSSAEYTSTIQALMKIGRTEGISALYKGFTPKALRMGIGGAVAVTAFEAVCEIAHSFD